jgi:hypothetical protein
MQHRHRWQEGSSIQLYVGHLLRQEIKPIRTPPLAAFARRLLACLLVE